MPQPPVGGLTGSFLRSTSAGKKIASPFQAAVLSNQSRQPRSATGRMSWAAARTAAPKPRAKARTITLRRVIVYIRIPLLLAES